MCAAEKKPRKRTRTRWSLPAKLRVLELWFSGMRARQVFKNLSSEGATGFSQPGVNSPHSHLRQFIEDVRNELSGSRRDLVVETLRTKVLPMIQRKCKLKSHRPISGGKHVEPLEFPEIEALLHYNNTRYTTAVTLLSEAGIVRRTLHRQIDPSTGAPEARLCCPVCAGNLMVQTTQIIFQYSYFEWNPRRRKYQRVNMTRGCPRPFTTRLDCKSCMFQVSINHRKWETNTDGRSYGKTLTSEQKRAIEDFVEGLGKPVPADKPSTCCHDEEGPRPPALGLATCAVGAKP